MSFKSHVIHPSIVFNVVTRILFRGCVSLPPSLSFLFTFPSIPSFSSRFSFAAKQPASNPAMTSVERCYLIQRDPRQSRGRRRISELFRA